jgi:hypothetical protein
MLPLRQHLFPAGIAVLAAAAACLDAQAMINVGPSPPGKAVAATAPRPPPPLRPEERSEPARPSTHATSADAILARNPFDSATGPLDRPVSGRSLRASADRPAAPAERRGPGGILDGITKIGPYEYRVRRDVVDRVLENQAEAMHFTRWPPPSPKESDGAAGLRLRGVRAGSVLPALGFEEGDALQRFNGLDILGPDKALEAYARLRSSDVIVVRLSRRGAPVVLVYYVV